MVKFILCLFASGFLFPAGIYLAVALGSLCRGRWQGVGIGLASAAIPMGFYALSWKFLPMENWVIIPGGMAFICSVIAFVATLKAEEDGQG